MLLLQQILFYRELDFPLEAIRDLVTRPDFDMAGAVIQGRVPRKPPFTTALMNDKMKKLGNPPVRKYLEMLVDGGAISLPAKYLLICLV